MSEPKHDPSKPIHESYSYYEVVSMNHYGCRGRHFICTTSAAEARKIITDLGVEVISVTPMKHEKDD